jgi:NAD(P)-dependent dehydrogenase (short-subunit alcohol dehydrogenase family)
LQILCIFVFQFDKHGYVCDVTDEPAVQAMVATIAKEVGTIDILVNNGGILAYIGKQPK